MIAEQIWEELMGGLLISGVRQEQDIYVRLIDSVTKQVSHKPHNSYNAF